MTAMDALGLHCQPLPAELDWRLLVVQLGAGAGVQFAWQPPAASTACCSVVAVPVAVAASAAVQQHTALSVPALPCEPAALIFAETNPRMLALVRVAVLAGAQQPVLRQGLQGSAACHPRQASPTSDLCISQACRMQAEAAQGHKAPLCR